MAKAYNKIVVVGNAGRDAEQRTTANGSSVANFTLATNDGWGDNERTNWHRIVAFGKLADVVGQYVSKGDRVLVEGRMDYGSYEKDGVTIPTAEIVASEVVFLGGEREPVTATDASVPNDDLPF